MIQEHLLTISAPLDLLNDPVDEYGKDNEANKNGSRRIKQLYVVLQQHWKNETNNDFRQPQETSN